MCKAINFNWKRQQWVSFLVVKEYNVKYSVSVFIMEGICQKTQITELLKSSQTEQPFLESLLSLLQKWAFTRTSDKTVTSGQPVLISMLLLNSKTVLLYVSLKNDGSS